MIQRGMHGLSQQLRASLVEHARAVAARALGSADEPRAPDCGGLCLGALVSVRRGGKATGFMGSLEQRPVVEAVEAAARMAAVEDPRYEPSFFGGEVDVDVFLVGPRREVRGVEELTPSDGVMVASGLNRAVHLPGLLGIGEGREGVLASACVAADLHPKAWRGDDVRVVAFPVAEL